MGIYDPNTSAAWVRPKSSIVPNKSLPFYYLSQYDGKCSKMKFSLLAIIATISSSPVEVNKRAWLTGVKMMPMEDETSFSGTPTESTRLVSKFRIVLGTETAKQYRYRLRFTQLDGYFNPTNIVINALPNTNGVVLFYTTDFITEEWNAIGSTVTLDRIIPYSGVWQNEMKFNVACSPTGKLNNFAYAGNFTFNCTNYPV